MSKKQVILVARPRRGRNRSNGRKAEKAVFIGRRPMKRRRHRGRNGEGHWY